MQALDKKTTNTINFHTLDELEFIIKRDNLNIPVSRDLSPLGKKKYVNTRSGKIELQNSLTVHPMEGFDGEEDGTPGPLTHRRYMRFASSGAGLIWSEAISVVPEGRTSNHQLWINDNNKDEYKKLVSDMKKITSAPVIAQLTHSGRFSKNSSYPYPIIATRSLPFEKVRPNDVNVPLVSDKYLDSLPEKFAHAAELCVYAGFDGIDIKACHQYLLSELLSAHTRSGKYGGSYENRTRLFKDIILAIKNVVPENIILASRLGIYDDIEYPYGFGSFEGKEKELNLTESSRLIKEIGEIGISLIDMTMGSPYLNPHVNRPYNKGGYVAEEHPLVGVSRLLTGCEIIQKENKDITIIGTGYSYLSEFAPYVAAGALEKGICTLVGFGRMAFAYDTFAKDFINGIIDKKKVCITCSKCTEIMRKGGTTGCPIRDQEVYLPIYKKYCMDK